MSSESSVERQYRRGFLQVEKRTTHELIASDMTPQTASGTQRRHPVLPKTAADAMPELTVAVFATDDEQLTFLPELVDRTVVAHTALTFATYPVAASDPVTVRVRNVNPNINIVDIPADDPTSALEAIELLRQEMPNAAIIASGNMNKPQILIDTMRAGARDFIERRTTADVLLEVFGRLTGGDRNPLSKRRLAREGIQHPQRDHKNEPRALPVINESPRMPLRKGMHVKVRPTRPDGKPHPHAGKTGRITRFVRFLLGTDCNDET